MSNEVYDFNIGHSTAYAYAKASGDLPEGMTPEEYGELLASYATVGQTAVTAAQTATTKASEAATSATTATNKASEATTAATTATTKAGEASTSASTATSAKDTAVSASQTATAKATEATTAAATATSAATTATTAKDDAVSAKTAAQTAQTGAETAAASVQSSAEQIQTNTDDISELKEDLKNAIDDIANDTIPLLVEKGEYVAFTGAFVASPLWSRTGYIRVDKYIYIDITTTKASAYNCFYDSNHEVIMHFQIQSGTTNRPIPDNAVYMALSNESADMLNTVVTPRTTKKDEEIQQEFTNLGTSKISKLTEQDQNYLFELFLTGVDISKTLVIGQIANKYPVSNGYYNGIYISYDDDPYNWIAGWTIDYETEMPSVVKLLEQGNSGVSGYALIDYTSLTEGTRIYPMIPINNDSVTDMGNSPAISAYVNGYKSDDINVLNADMDMAVIQSSKTRANLFPSANSVLEFVHFSDIHGVEKAWKRVVSYINTHRNYLQFAIMTGDYVVSAQDSTVDLYGQVTPFNRPILNVVGNHDIQVDDGGSTADKAETYRRLFADASNWGATFGTGENIMYYYKDFTSSKIRLVVIDQYYWDATEASWLVSVLNDARTNGYHVITASHTQSGVFNRMLNTTFNTIDNYEPYTQWGDNVEPFELYIKAFKENGGVHIVHLCGHWHHDMTGVTTNGILNMVIESASPFAVPWLNALRIDGTKSYDCFNVIAVDTNVNILKVIRIGNAYDGYLQHKTVLCIDYENQTIKRFEP